jgi:hypothetical protein
VATPQQGAKPWCRYQTQALFPPPSMLKSLAKAERFKHRWVKEFWFSQVSNVSFHWLD